MKKNIILILFILSNQLYAMTAVQEYEDYVKRYDVGVTWNIEAKLKCTIAKQTLQKAKKQTKYKSAVSEWTKKVSLICN